MNQTARNRLYEECIRPGMSRQAKDARLLISLHLAKALVSLEPADRNRLLLALQAEIMDTLEALELEDCR